jgi:3-hydroxyacyl-[acyl-carrier-protein] dehydratase
MENKPDEDEMYFFVGIDNARFKRPVGPGDQVRLDVELIKRRRRIWKFYGEASVDGQLVTSAELLCTHRSIDEIRR